MRVFFLRDANKFPVACIASEKEGEQIKFAVSIWNPKDTFNRARGRNIATQRLLQGKHVKTISADKPKAMIMWELTCDTHLPERVRAAAELWLERTTN